MDIKPEELLAAGFKEKDHLDHQQLIPFIQTYLKKKTMSSRFFNAANMLFLGLLIGFFVYNYIEGRYSVSKGITHSCYGMAMAIALIPIHEYLHVLAYRYVGAQQTSYDANLKKFYFMAIADRFVANRKEFQIVAITPFATISILSFLSLFFIDGPWVYAVLSLVFTHTNFCSGDFGLLSYFDFHADQEIVTYDDKSNGISYFYSR